MKFYFFTIHFSPHIISFKFSQVCPEYILRRNLFLLVISFWRHFSHSVLHFSLLRFLIPIYICPTDVEYDLEQRFSAGGDFAPGNICHSLEMFWIVTTGAVPLTSSGWEPGMLLNIYSAQGSPSQRTIWPEISVVLRLRDPDLQWNEVGQWRVCVSLALALLFLVLWHKR